MNTASKALLITELSQAGLIEHRDTTWIILSYPSRTIYEDNKISLSMLKEQLGVK